MDALAELHELRRTSLTKGTVLDEDGHPLWWPQGLPWSHSALGRFEECSLLYGETNVMKNYPYVESEAMRTGKVTHKQLEDYVSSGVALPHMLNPIGKLVDAICKGAKEVLPERDVNLSYKIEPCGTFHDDISYRGRIDLTVVRPDNEAIIFDYKTGREPKDPFEQIEYQALALLAEKPYVRKVHGAYIYTKHPKRWMTPVTRDMMPEFVRRITPRLERMKAARQTKSYVPRPGDHCRWCPVITCKYNSKRN